MPKLSDFIVQFHAAEIVITLAIICLIVGIRERFNIKKWLGIYEEKKDSIKTTE